MAEPKIAIPIDVLWLLEIVEWGRARGMSDPDIFAKLLETLRTAAAEGKADPRWPAADGVAEEKAAEGE